MPAENTRQDSRLPDGVVPTHYRVELRPDIAAASFTGRVIIELDCLTPTRRITCNAADLEIRSVTLEVGGDRSAPHFRLEPEAEQLHIEVDAEIPIGPSRLSIDFSGTLNDMLQGFYRSTYTDDDGNEKVVATTQFQSTDARRAFPCWDEPAYKAVFESTLVVEPEHLAVSNTAIVSDEVDPDGRRRVEFAPTMPMSTYLVAYVVGPLEATQPIDVNGTPVRVVHRPGQGHLTEFALDVARHSLAYYEDYYGIAYPSDKLDLVAVPDFAFGAMENLGCVTFREVLLLVDPDHSSQPELQRVADVINHELAHMWFGDLVTMKWWEGIWLNEAFATFMETKCSDHYRPDWDVWTTFGRARAAAFSTDALRNTRPIEYPVVSPQDAEGMYDILTYEKGASTVRMLEQFLGHDRFREGVRHYLHAHSYSNTETSDLWASLEHITGLPVGEIMKSWIFQGGHPLVTVEQDAHGASIGQRHFTLDPAAASDKRWQVPVRIRATGDSPITSVLLDSPTVRLTAPHDHILSANADGSGFYRVQLGGSLFRRIIESKGQGLNAPERHAFIDDAWALTLAGQLHAADYLEAAESFASDPDLTVWQALSVGFAGLTRFVDEGAEPALRERIGAIARPMADTLGMEASASDSDRTRELRATLIRLMGAVADDSSTIAQCRPLLEHVDPTVASAALFVVAHHGGDDDYQRVRDAWLNAADPQSEQRNLRSLADFPDPGLVSATLSDTLNGQIRSQDGPYLIRRALTNRHAGSIAWEFIESNWAKINETFPTNSISRMLEGIVALDSPGAANRVSAFLASHPVPQGDKQIAQHLETQEINIAARQREIKRFSTWVCS